MWSGFWFISFDGVWGLHWCRGSFSPGFSVLGPHAAGLRFCFWPCARRNQYAEPGAPNGLICMAPGLAAGKAKALPTCWMYVSGSFEILKLVFSLLVVVDCLLNRWKKRFSSYWLLGGYVFIMTLYPLFRILVFKMSYESQLFIIRITDVYWLYSSAK